MRGICLSRAVTVGVRFSTSNCERKDYVGEVRQQRREAQSWKKSLVTNTFALLLLLLASSSSCILTVGSLVLVLLVLLVLAALVLVVRAELPLLLLFLNSCILFHPKHQRVAELQYTSSTTAAARQRGFLAKLWTCAKRNLISATEYPQPF